VFALVFALALALGPSLVDVLPSVALLPLPGRPGRLFAPFLVSQDHDENRRLIIVIRVGIENKPTFRTFLLTLTVGGVVATIRTNGKRVTIHPSGRTLSNGATLIIGTTHIIEHTKQGGANVILRNVRKRLTSRTVVTVLNQLIDNIPKTGISAIEGIEQMFGVFLTIGLRVTLEVIAVTGKKVTGGQHDVSPWVVFI
jgi:hypothetical protein